jgi:hypothetical protein
MPRRDTTFGLASEFDDSTPHAYGNWMMVSRNLEKSIVDVSPSDRAAIDEKEALLAEVRNRFQRSPYWELHDVICDFREGVLTLRGRVPSYFFKQVAQSIVFSLERIDEIDNRLMIVG